jgi:hypothetical protein
MKPLMEDSVMKTLHIEGLPPNFKDTDLARPFLAFGAIERATVVKSTHILKLDYGLVDFVKDEDADRAIAQGVKIRGCAVKVTAAQHQSEASHKRNVPGASFNSHSNRTYLKNPL